MKMRVWIAFVFLAGTAGLRGQDSLPRKSPGEPMDFEPKQMLEGPGASPAPVVTVPPISLDDRVQLIEMALAVAQKRSSESEDLFKDGILAKVEVEERALRVVELTRQLDDAKLALAQAQADAVKKSFDAHQASQADLDAANAALNTAQQTAVAATAQWNQAQLNAATLDVQRKRKLYYEGVATRRELEMAEERLTLLTGATAASPSP